VLMVVITTRSVTTARPFIVPVPLPVPVVIVMVVVVRPVLVAGVTTVRVCVSHARLLSRAV
jgi:hypothetical protein